MSIDTPVAEQPAPARRSLLQRIVRNPWFPLFAAFIATGLVMSFIAKPYWVPSGSMEETLVPGDRTLVNRLAYLGGEPSNGDIIVFEPEQSWAGVPAAEENPLKAALRWAGEVSGFGPSGPNTLIKRVIGTPGQSVKCCTDDGSLTVDGEPVDEPYVANNFEFTPGVLDCATVPASLRCFPAVEVPTSSYLMLGDNRSNSSDSAIMCRGATDPPENCWRWALRDDVVGKAVVILWPIDRWAGL